MDITLIKTFLQVAATGSFVAASNRLFVTQSAVSLRVQRLEDSLGRQLFTRSKAGAVLTASGREFEHYALSLLKLWEEARQQVAIPAGFTHSLTIGAQYSLWPRLGFRWIDDMQSRVPGLSIRAELGMPDRLTRFLIEGVVQAALLYTPQLRPGLEVEKVLNDELILLASWPDPTLDLEGRYVFVDWGPEFTHSHALDLPELPNTGLTMALGALAADYVVNRKAAAYLPARAARKYLESGQLHLVPEAPRFPYPAWAVWREDIDPKIAAMAKTSLSAVAFAADDAQQMMLNRLAQISNAEEVEEMGGNGRRQV